MNTAVIAAAVIMLANSAAFAANSSCESKADKRQLLGAARTSFIIKCEGEKSASNVANKSCEAQATSEKVSGAAKSSFVKKCVKDATVAQKPTSHQQKYTTTQHTTTQHAMTQRTTTKKSKQQQHTRPQSALSSFGH